MVWRYLVCSICELTNNRFVFLIFYHFIVEWVVLIENMIIYKSPNKRHRTHHEVPKKAGNIFSASSAFENPVKFSYVCNHTIRQSVCVYLYIYNLHHLNQLGSIELCALKIVHSTTRNKCALNDTHTQKKCEWKIAYLGSTQSPSQWINY